jgi:hypothetical protein
MKRSCADEDAEHPGDQHQQQDEELLGSVRQRRRGQRTGGHDDAGEQEQRNAPAVRRETDVDAEPRDEGIDHAELHAAAGLVIVQRDVDRPEQ